MGKFTSGEWKYDNGDIVVIDDDGDDIVIAGMGQTSRCRQYQYTLVDNKEKRANANLIAAAPDMYEALKLALEEHNKKYDKCTDCAVYTKITKALAKAEGGK